MGRGADRQLAAEGLLHGSRRRLEPEQSEPKPQPESWSAIEEDEGTFYAVSKGERIGPYPSYEEAAEQAERENGVIRYDRWEDFEEPLRDRWVDVDAVPAGVRERVIDSWPFTSYNPLGDSEEDDQRWWAAGGV